MSEEKKDLGHMILNEIHGSEPGEEKQKKPFLGKAAIPLLAILTDSHQLGVICLERNDDNSGFQG